MGGADDFGVFKTNFLRLPLLTSVLFLVVWAWRLLDNLVLAFVILDLDVGDF